MALETVDARGVITRLDRALQSLRAEPSGEATRPVLAFDADGTLWRGDVGCDLFAGAIDRKAFRGDARELFVREARSMGLAEDGDVHALGARLLETFLSGRWEDGPAAVAMAVCYVGLSPEELSSLADEVLGRVGLLERIHPGVVDVIAWAGENGVETHVVSASPLVAVVSGARRLSIPSERVIAMRMALRPDGRYGTELEGESVYGEGKVHAIDRVLAGATLLGAFGDSAGDAFMLRRARVPVAVGPSDRLLAIADTVPGLTVLPFPSPRPSK